MWYNCITKPHKYHTITPYMRIFKGIPHVFRSPFFRPRTVKLHRAPKSGGERARPSRSLRNSEGRAGSKLEKYQKSTGTMGPCSIAFRCLICGWILWFMVDVTKYSWGLPTDDWGGHHPVGESRNEHGPRGRDVSMGWFQGIFTGTSERSLPFSCGFR